MGLGDGFDPRKLGARCDACVLQKCRPVPPERNPEATFAVIGDYPSDDDERNGVLYSGAAGKLLMRAFRAALTDRKHMHLTNTLLCRPPAGDLTKVLALVTKENQARDARNRKLRQQYEQLRKSQPWMEEPKYEEPIPTPQECCAPRLAAEVQRFTQFVSLGAIALRFVGNTKASVMAIRGGMTELAETDLLPERRLMPTVHPSFVLHAGRYLRVFFSDIERAVRWFRGGLKWEKTQITYHPTAEVLRAFLSAPAGYFTFDLETDGIEPLTANIRCVGIWRPDNQAVVVGTLGKDGARQFYTAAELERVKRVLIDFFENEKIVKVAHNSPYDNTVLLQQWKTKAVPVIDTILLHRLVESELPHNLGFVGSLYTDAPSWKCYDGETEVLTPDGWVRFPALQRGVPVAQWDNGVVSFVPPHAYVDQEYTGTVWELTNACVDLVVTPGHKMVYRQDDGPKFHTCAVENLPRRGEMPNTGRLDNPGCLLSEEEIRLLVAVQAAGTWERNGSEISALITATQMRKLERVPRFALKRKIPIAIVSDKAVRLTPSAALFFIHRFLGDKKEFGPWIFSLSLLQRAWLLDEFKQWHKKMPADKTTLDWIQACAAVSNWETPGLPLARLYPSLSSITRKEVPFSGRIYCVSVPSGLLLVRRNGKVVVSGNTDREGRKIAFDAETDEQLHEYCALDCQVTGQVLPRLLSSVQIRNQNQLIPIDHAVQRACLDMHRVGFWINQEKRAKAEKKYIEIVTKTMGDLRKICGIPDYNPGSPIQTRAILFGTWHLTAPLKEEERFTESGLESINDFVLRALLTTRLTDQQRTFIMTLRRYRKAMKLLGTYIVKLRYSNQTADIGWDEDEEAEDRELRLEMKERYGIERMGIVDVRTGRMYPGFSAHVPVTGRLASSKPINCQNFPKFLRALAEPFTGNCYIGADADQLELRIAAALWGATKYLRAFDAGADPHSTTAYGIFGDRFQTAEGFPGGRWDGDLFIPDGTGKWSGDAKNYRDLAKKVQYASQYKANVDTVHRVIAQTEVENPDGTTSLPFLNLPLSDVRQMHQAWLSAVPEFERGWEREVNEWRAQGYLEEPVSGRRRDFLDGENPNELVNFKVQGAAASLMNKAMIALHAEYHAHCFGYGTGLNSQVHDAMTIEVPLDGASFVMNPEKPGDGHWDVPKGSIPWRCMNAVNEAMNQVHERLPGVKITAAADIGKSWKEVG